MKRLFGTDGIRGVAGEFPLDEKTIFVAGQSLARQLTKKNNLPKVEFVVGRDTRESGAWIEKFFCAGAQSAGAECISAGVITTPGVAFLAAALKVAAGVVISASHNPFQDNGIKIFAHAGRKIDEETERQIEADIYQARASNFEMPIQNASGQTSQSKLQHDAKELHELYLNSLKSNFSDLSLKNLKIAVDCANGAASAFAPRLLESFGAQVTAISNAPDGRNINLNCGSLHLEHLQKHVRAESADFGVAYDGDADRALFVDADGQFVDGDAILWVMAKHLQERGALKNNTVIATVMSNLGLEMALKSRAIELVRTQVGDKYVLDELLKTGASLGGEQSGHIIFTSSGLVGDGLLTTLFLLAAMRENNCGLADLTAGFVKFPQILLNVRVREKIPFENVRAIVEVVRTVENEIGENGRLLLRYSGTESLARVMLEGENQEIITAQANRVANVIRKELG